MGKKKNALIVGAITTNKVPIINAKRHTLI